jgi:membrane protein YdbS with pleckstrin-like domain
MEQAQGDDRSSKLDPRSVVAARLTGGIVLVCVALPTLVGVGLTSLFSPWNTGQKIGLFVAWVGLIGLWAVTAFFVPALRYRATRYRVDDRGLTIRRGILWRTVTSVPKSRVQHTDVLQGPLQRQFELATLVIHTAGTQDASVSLSGLAHHTALPIRDFLIGGGHDGV